MRKHPKLSVIKSNPRVLFGPTPALSVSRVHFFSIACVRGSFHAFLEIEAWAKNPNNQLLNYACKKNASTSMRTINEI